MSTEYVGSVTLYVGATEVEVTKIDVKNITGKKEVKTILFTPPCKVCEDRNLNIANSA